MNVVDRARPRPFRRRSRGTFVAALHALEESPPDPLWDGYPVLVRALANVSLAYVPGTGVWFTTLERGSHLVPCDDGLHTLAGKVVDRLEPLARSRLVIDNEFRPDLEPDLWGGDDLTRSIADAGRRLDTLGLLPAPFPVEDLVDANDLRHIKRLYGIGGLSYGNLSARKDETRFWMSASGVDKAKLVHAWLEGIPATEVNYPCGTEELAANVAELLAAEPDPAHAVIGLRNPRHHRPPAQASRRSSTAWLRASWRKCR